MSDTHSSPDEPNSSEENSKSHDLRLEFGSPLRRVVNRLETADELSQDLCELSLSPSSASSSATSSSLRDFEAVVDGLLANGPPPEHPDNLLPVSLPSSSVAPPKPILLKHLPLASPELLILLYLNTIDTRSDLRNPAPRILCAVERGDSAYLCLERLVDWNCPPLGRVSEFVDFFRQVLEGLSFLHEHKLTSLTRALSLSSIKVDLCPSESFSSSPHTFDRSKYPVRYYFTNFEEATKIEGVYKLLEYSRDPFKRDVCTLGEMLGGLLDDVPQIAMKFRSLVTAMKSEKFGADDARKLFEALCKSLDARVFEGVVVRRHSMPS